MKSGKTPCYYMEKEVKNSVAPASRVGASSTTEIFTLQAEERQSYLAELLKKKKNAASGAGGSGLMASRKMEAGVLLAVREQWST
ncbi:hypothetical protein Tco_1506183 [Tanacetum coccineum]